MAPKRGQSLALDNDLGFLHLYAAFAELDQSIMCNKRRLESGSWSGHRGFWQPWRSAFNWSSANVIAVARARIVALRIDAEISVLGQAYDVVCWTSNSTKIKQIHIACGSKTSKRNNTLDVIVNSREELPLPSQAEGLVWPSLSKNKRKSDLASFWVIFRITASAYGFLKWFAFFAWWFIQVGQRSNSSTMPKQQWITTYTRNTSVIVFELRN